MAAAMQRVYYSMRGVKAGPTNTFWKGPLKPLRGSKAHDTKTVGGVFDVRDVGEFVEPQVAKVLSDNHHKKAKWGGTVGDLIWDVLPNVVSLKTCLSSSQFLTIIQIFVPQVLDSEALTGAINDILKVLLLYILAFGGPEAAQAAKNGGKGAGLRGIHIWNEIPSPEMEALKTATKMLPVELNLSAEKASSIPVST